MHIMKFTMGEFVITLEYEKANEVTNVFTISDAFGQGEEIGAIVSDAQLIYLADTIRDYIKSKKEVSK